MRPLRWTAMLGGLCLLSSSAAGQHVVFAAARLEPVRSHVVRAYFDADGMLYPPGPRVIDARRLKNSGSLAAYYAASPETFQQLREALGIRSTVFSSAWAEVQDSLAASLAHQLDREADAASASSLVVLIHGFNVEDATEAYRVARNRMSAATTDRQVFLEVHWDGMQGYNVVNSWRTARRNAPRVGLGVRRVLSRTAWRPALRVLTHSLGASVAASAFWDRRVDVVADQLVDGEYLRLAGGKGLPFPAPLQLRVAMIVPAIPGSALQRARGASAGTSLAAMAIGQNERDYAVSKAFLGADALGSTRLGTTEAEFAGFVRARWPEACRYEIRNRTLVAVPDPWTLSFKKVEGHDMALYLADPSVMPLLRRLTVRDPKAACG
jgi:hypothetical protein